MIGLEEYRARRAELEVLELYNGARIYAGHDFGAGQRYAELVRRRRELEGDWETLATPVPTAEELALAFERVARPRIARLEAETYRRETPATRRSLATWRRLEGRLA